MGPAAENPLRDVFVGRQPIYGRQLELYAYELLYRSGDVDFADFADGDRATSQVLLNTFSEFGLERVVGGNLAFVNLTRGFITGEYPLPVPRTRVVLEVLENVVPDEAVLEGLRRLRRQGFRIALDDFVHSPEFEPLLPFADIIKIDVLGLGADEIREKVEDLKPYGAKLLAEKIETRAQFERCLRAGFHYFQGYFLARPNVVQGKSLSVSSLNLLRLLAELQDPACDGERVAAIVGQDVTLSYRLLRHADAALGGGARRVSSMMEAVSRLGLLTVKNVASLMVLSNAGRKPHEVTVTAMLRAKMCEGLARRSGAADVHAFFTAGLFSLLDAILDAPIGMVLGRLPLGDDLVRALGTGAGPIGEALACTLAYERGDWENVRCAGLTRAEIKGAFLEAVTWVEGIDHQLSGAA